MGAAWFESIAEAHRRARRRLPSAVYAAVLAGSERGATHADNIASFAEIGLAPRVAGLKAERQLSTTFMGQPISFPVVTAPTGTHAVHPQGEVAVARATASRGTAMVLSSFGSRPLSDVIAANPMTFAQWYWIGGRDRMLERLASAKEAGAKGVVVTLDWSFLTRRDWGSPAIPQRVDFRTAMKFAPQVAKRPVWLASFARGGGFPDLTTPNLVSPRGEIPTLADAYLEWKSTPPCTWDDLAWLRSQWDGPFMIKGICRVDDARLAVQAGFSSISVSNHGGNNIDGTPAAIRLVPAIVDAVGDEVEVVMDGGVRRGSDVIKALALGAKAVMIGRPYLWGLAANGQAGVENVLDILREGIDATLYGLGHGSVHELSPSDVIVPSGFPRAVDSGKAAQPR